MKGKDGTGPAGAPTPWDFPLGAAPLRPDAQVCAAPYTGRLPGEAVRRSKGQAGGDERRPHTAEPFIALQGWAVGRGCSTHSRGKQRANQAGVTFASWRVMSKRMIELAVERLVTDERLRIRFLRSRIEALTDLALRGIELTPDEIALFIQTDARVWFWAIATDGPLH